MAFLKLSMLRKPRAVYLTHWIFELIVWGLNPNKGEHLVRNYGWYGSISVL